MMRLLSPCQRKDKIIITVEDDLWGCEFLFPANKSARRIRCFTQDYLLHYSNNFTYFLTSPFQHLLDWL